MVMILSHHPINPPGYHFHLSLPSTRMCIHCTRFLLSRSLRLFSCWRHALVSECIIIGCCATSPAHPRAAFGVALTHYTGGGHRRAPFGHCSLLVTPDPTNIDLPGVESSMRRERALVRDEKHHNDCGDTRRNTRNATHTPHTAPPYHNCARTSCWCRRQRSTCSSLH